MQLDPDTCHKALTARDARFDGVFFVGVTTTGIYCRPICPARTPGPTRCRYFRLAAEAERAGFRACLRCRPELAPGLASVDATSRLVRAAAARIHAGYLDQHSVDELADLCSVTARHLRRVMEDELGVSPIELAQTRRLAVARRLLRDTALPMTDVAFAAGFASLRRFNAAFLERYGRPPTALRRESPPADRIRLRLDFRPPYAWDRIVGFLAGRAIPGVERIDAEAWRRVVVIGDTVGTVSVRPDPDRSALIASVSTSLAPRLPMVAARLRSVFDLDARPDQIADVLRADTTLAPRIEALPGLRVPGAFEPFETAVRAILGQQVSVAAASTICARLVARYGRDVVTDDPSLNRAFPTPAVLAAAEDLASIGLPAARARTIHGLARAVLAGLDLGDDADPEPTIAALQAIPGIGPWTAQYIAMRSLHWPDAFPGGDLVVRKALGVTTLTVPDARAAAWRPWRAYAVMHLWAGGGG